MADTAHSSQPDWTPAAAPSLWVEICETHGGTIDDPIPYSGNMALEFEVIYRRTRDMINPEHNALVDLAGIYVKAAA